MKKISMILAGFAMVALVACGEVENAAQDAVDA